MSQYNPISHFFVDETKLASIVAANYTADAFGPVTGSLTTKYRTSSFVRAIDANPVKVFAICDGQLLIQPQTGDATKVNLILKPSKSFAPLKIKYFVYRGVRKSDLLGGIAGTSAYLSAPDLNDANQPAFLKKLWNRYIAFVTSIIDPGTGDPMPAPTEFLSSDIGYDESQSGTVLLDHCFTKKGMTNSLYQIPLCTEGEHIANFTTKVALDIVLDYGDHELVNQELLFKLDLDFARKAEHFFDTTTPALTTPVKIKRYKEYIHQFIDPAAFWGSHIECGLIKTVATPAGTKDNATIFTNFVSKYQTQSKIYVYIQGENNRSYNYYETTRMVAFDLVGSPKTLVPYNTNDWPILIKDESVPASIGAPGFLGFVQYDIDSNIEPQEKHISIDVISPNNNTSSYPLIDKPTAYAGEKRVVYKIVPNLLKTTSNFMMLFCNLKQTFPLKKYYNDLFPVNFQPTFEQPSISNKSTYWSVYDRNRMVNIEDVIDVGATIQNKLVFDTGKSQPSMSLKRRRLYMAIIKNNTNHDADKVFDALDVQDVTSGFVKSIIDSQQYILNLYTDPGYSVYKGTFLDGTNTIPSLALFHETNLIKKNSFFHLGITDEEYNTLVYNNIAVSPTQYLPIDADNVFFSFEEVTTFTTQNVKKFKLGLQYENSAGNIAPVLFPTADVFVYSVDGLYFFSKEYASLQEFYEDYARCKVDFRIKQPYSGEFGFDWMRVGDTGAPGDVDYKNHVGKLYVDAAHTIVETNSNEDGTPPNTRYFNVIPKMYRRLEREYRPFPLQWETNNKVEKYYIPLLTLYPPYAAPTPPTIDLDRQIVFTPPYNDDINRVARLSLKIKVAVAATRIELVYDTSNLNIISAPATIPVTVGSHTVDITVRCLRDFGTEQLIKVVAFYGASTKGKLVGAMRITPNIKAKRFSKKLLLIDVITNLTGVVRPLNFSVKTHSENLKKFLRQIEITPEIGAETIDLVTFPDPTFNSNYVYTNPVSGQKFISGFDESNPTLIQIVDFLYNKLTLQVPTGSTTPIGTKYDAYFKVFLFHDEGGYTDASGAYAGLSGFSNGSDKLVDYPNIYPSTATHEFLHTAKVPHTFAAYEASPFAKYTYDHWVTDNIMDYSDVNSTNPTTMVVGLPTISLFDWQGSVAKKYMDSEP